MVTERVGQHWSLVATWYMLLFFTVGLLFVPYRMIRRGQRRRDDVAQAQVRYLDRMSANIGPDLGAPMHGGTGGAPSRHLNPASPLPTALRAPAPQRATASTPVPSASPNVVDELARLADLHERGVLSAEEFASAKARVLKSAE